MANDNGMGLATIGNGAAVAHRQPETTTAHSSAMAKAEVEARFAVAIGRPRDIDQARLTLLKDCRRPGFAELAVYSKPVGGKSLEGPSIRLVEAALRAYGNMDVRSPTILEDDEKRIVRVTVTDLETNLTFSDDVVVSKTVERRSLKDGQTALGSRANSYGQTVYIVGATDDDVATKRGALVSKTMRTLGVRALPGDLIDEAMFTARETMRNADAKDPKAARRKIIDLFDAEGVSPADLAKFLGKPLADVLPPDDLATLRKAYAAVKERHTTWAELMAAKDAPAATGTKVDQAKAKLGKKDAPSSEMSPEEMAEAEKLSRGDA